MEQGILWAVLAGLMLGLYALPGKFTKDFKFENTWGLFFLLTMFVVPLIATFILVEGVGGVYAGMTPWRLALMVGVSFLWGCGVMMWGKAINHIGLSLGFSLFIGTVILVGSLLPWCFDGLPPKPALITILAGIFVVLLGIMSNGRAGLLREKDEAAGKSASADAAGESKGSMALGISIAVFGGLLATGFSVANTVGRPEIHELCQKLGNAEWMTAVGVMFPIFLSGGAAMAAYFTWQLTQKRAWGGFRTSHFPINFVLIFIMAFFHYAASAVFAYSAFRLGDLGNSVGYAIFNTTCVVVAVLSGIVTGEWAKASARAKGALYLGLGCMVAGIIVVAFGNTLS